MQKQNQTRLFAFKLAEKEVSKEVKQPWQVRDGVAVAGCTYYGDPEDYNLRDSSRFAPNDTGVYC